MGGKRNLSVALICLFSIPRPVHVPILLDGALRGYTL